MTRVVVIAYLGETSEAVEHAHESPLTMLAPMAALTLLAIVGGYAGAQLGELWGGEIAFHLAPVGIVTSLLGISAIGYGYLRYAKNIGGPSPDGLRTFILGGPVDRFWDGTWRKAILPTARKVAWVDRYVIDGAINWFGWAAIRGTEAIRRLQTGRSQDYAVAVIIGVLFFVIYGTVGS